MRSSLQANIRKATVDDLPKIVERTGPSGGTPFYPFTALDKLQNIPLDRLIVAEWQGEYVGFLYWYSGENPEFDESAGKYGYIEEAPAKSSHVSDHPIPLPPSGRTCFCPAMFWAIFRVQGL